MDNGVKWGRGADILGNVGQNAISHAGVVEEKARTPRNAIDDIDKKMAKAFFDNLPEIEKILSEGGSAEDFAKKAASIAQYKLLKDLFSDDERLSQSAAEKILDRAHGKVAGSAPVGNTVNVNLIDATSDDDKRTLARKLMFMGELMKRKSLPVIDVNEEIVDE